MRRGSGASVIVLAVLLLSSSLPGKVSASPTIAVTPFSTVYQGDTNHISFKVYFNVTNTGSVLDYVTLQRSGMFIQPPPGVPCQGIGSQTPSGCLALGVPSPEFGVSLQPGETKPMRANVDIGYPAAGSFKVTFPFRSELTGITVNANVTLVVAEADQSNSGTVSGTVTSAGGSPISGATLQVVSLTTNQPTPSGMVDPGGRFVQKVWPDAYVLRVDAPGYEGASRMVNVSAQQTVNLQFVLSPALYGTGAVVSSIVNLSDSSWTLTGSSDLSQLTSAPMNHGGTPNMNANGTFFGIAGGKIAWKVPFAPEFGSHNDANQFQAADGYIGTSSDGRYAAAIDWNGVLYVINGTNGAVIASTDRAQDADISYPPNSEFRNGFFSVGVTAFSHDDKFLAAGGANGMVEVFSLPNMQLVWSKPLSAEIRGLKFTPDSSQLVVGSGDWHVYMVNAQNGATIWTGNDQFWPFFFIAMNQGGSLVGEGGKDGTFSLWNAQTGAKLWSRELFPGFVTSGAISADGTRVMFSHWAHGIFYYDGSGGYVWSRQFDNNPVADMTADGKFIFVATAVPTQVQPGQQGVGSLYLLDAQGTTIWSYTPDSSKYCQNPAPFPGGQFKSALIYESPDQSSVTVAASCIGGTVFEFRIPIVSITSTTTSTTTTSSTVTTTATSSTSSTTSTTTTMTSTNSTTSTSAVPEFPASALAAIVALLLLFTIVLATSKWSRQMRTHV